MHSTASFIFWLTLGLYLVTLFTVTYVGVYLTYVAIPVLLISGLIMKFSTPKGKHKEAIDSSKKALRQVGKASTEILDKTNSFLGELNTSLETYNKVADLVQTRTASIRKKIQTLKLERIPFEVQLKYDLPPLEIIVLKNKIKEINTEITSLEQSIEKIKCACELEVKLN
jgi:chromosome segregation ATPase